MLVASSKIPEKRFNQDNPVCVGTGSGSSFKSNVMESEVENMKFTSSSEGSIYDAILSAYEQGVEEHRDLCVEGSYVSIELLRKTKAKEILGRDVVRNSLLLLLALFYPLGNGDNLRGVDITCLPPEEQRELTENFEDILPVCNVD